MYWIILLFFPLSLFASTKIAIIGDSISIGYPVPKEKNYIELLRERYKKEEKDVIILNRSFGAATSRSMDTIAVNLMAIEYPDYVVLALGLNDALFNTPGAELLSNFNSTIFKLYFNNKVLLGGIDTSTICSHYNNNMANMYRQILQIYKNVIAWNFLTSEILNTAKDRIHPDERGHEMIANNLYLALQEAGL